MKKNWQTILLAVMCVMLGICMAQIADLKEQLHSFENNTYNRLSYVEMNVNRLYSGIDEKLEQQAKILADSEWSYGEADVDAGTVLLKVSISPKEYRPEATEAYVSCNDTEYLMTLEDGSYTVSIPISMYKESFVSVVKLRDGDAVRTEKLDWYVNPRYEYLPIVYAHYSGSSSGTGKNGVTQQGTYRKTFQGEIQLTIDQKGEYADDIQAVALVECLDDEVVEVTKIPEETWKASGHYPYSWPFEKTVSIPFGSTYGVYLEVVDGDGLRHRAWVEKETIDAEGNPVKNTSEFWRGAEASIHDAEGKLVYAPDGEWYRYRALSGDWETDIGSEHDSEQE